MRYIVYTGETNQFFKNSIKYKIYSKTRYGYYVYYTKEHIIEIGYDDCILLEEWREQRINKILED